MTYSTPLSSIVLSPTRLRGEVDDAKLAQLARSIKQQGVIHPPVARLVEEKYELVTGERRFLACQSLGMEEMELDVRELTDEQAVEIQLIENLQREDLTPLEEARAFVYLREAMGYAEKRIADRIGRARGYVHARMCLCDLTEAAEDALVRGQIVLGHANCLCRLQPEDQSYLLGRILEFGLDVEGLKGVIASELVRQLERAPFDCEGCPKTTTVQADLFRSMEIERGCLDGACWDQKMTEWIADSATGLRLSTESKKTKGDVLGFREWAEVEEGDDPPSIERGIIVDGYRRGTELDVCTDRDWVRAKRAPAPKEPKKDPAGDFLVEILAVSRIEERAQVEDLWLAAVLPRLNQSHAKRAIALVGVEGSDPKEWTDKEWMDFKLAVVCLGMEYPRKNPGIRDLESAWSES